MLQELHIENVAVIEKADVSLGSGLNILTGETGADKAVVCATFDPEPARAWCEDHEIDLDDELILPLGVEFLQKLARLP